jgi:hypothetical protein
LSAANYSITYSYSTYSVTKATPTINWTAPAAITYGTALSATQLNATTTPSGTWAYSPASGTILSAGSQTLSVTFTPTGASAGNYTTATASVTITVNKAPLTATVTGTQVYGGSPSYNATYATFVNGDTSSVVTGTLSCSTTATASSSVASTYTISACSGLSAANYSITYSYSTYSVTKAPLTATVTGFQSVGSSTPQYNATYATFVNGDTSSVVTGTLSCSTTATSSSAAGSSYSTKLCSGLSATNYNITYSYSTYTVYPAPAPVGTAYNGTFPSKTTTYTVGVTAATAAGDTLVFEFGNSDGKSISVSGMSGTGSTNCTPFVLAAQENVANTFDVEIWVASNEPAGCKGTLTYTTSSTSLEFAQVREWSGLSQATPSATSPTTGLSVNETLSPFDGNYTNSAGSASGSTKSWTATAGTGVVTRANPSSLLLSAGVTGSTEATNTATATTSSGSSVGTATDLGFTGNGFGSYFVDNGTTASTMSFGFTSKNTTTFAATLVALAAEGN